MKICSKCNTSKTIDKFRSHSGHADGHYSICRDCEKDAYWKLKKDVFSHYGGYKCAVCGETDPRKLEVDHINNDGNKHRAKNSGAAKKIIHWLKRNDYPEGFQILCHWCNYIKYISNSVEPNTKEWRQIITAVRHYFSI